MSLQIDLSYVGYRGKQVLSELHFALRDGELTAVIGQNGSGKSTLVFAVASLIPYRGSVTANGVSLSSLTHRERAQILSALLQESPRPHMTVEELVCCGRTPYASLFGGMGERDRLLVEDALVRADLSHLRHRNADTLSGGELRRAYFGAVLAQDTQNVLLDEATAFMDADHTRRFLEMERDLAHESGRAVMAVMHDLSMAVAYADRILLLDGGTQLFFGTPEELLTTDLIEKSFCVKRFCADGRIFFA